MTSLFILFYFFFKKTGSLLSEASLNAKQAVPASLRHRPYFTYRFNLMEHIGHLSSRLNASYGGDGPKRQQLEPMDPQLAPKPNGLQRNKLWTMDELRGTKGRLCYPACYSPIQYVGLMTYENFNDDCFISGEQLSPCVCPSKPRYPTSLQGVQSLEWAPHNKPLCMGMPFMAILDKVDQQIRAGFC